MTIEYHDDEALAIIDAMFFAPEALGEPGSLRQRMRRYLGFQSELSDALGAKTCSPAVTRYLWRAACYEPTGVQFHDDKGGIMPVDPDWLAYFHTSDKSSIGADGHLDFRQEMEDPDISPIDLDAERARAEETWNCRIVKATGDAGSYVV